MARVALALCVLWISVAPVAACLNDQDTLREERQFKSLYPDVTTPSEPTIETPNNVLAYGASTFGGVALLGFAGYLGFTRRLV
jgi:hypothetical protein